jgi:predicted transcriptional regulator
MELTTPELKFVLKLLGHPQYQAAIAELKPNSKTSASERDRICRSLTSKGIVSHDHEIKKFGLTAAGRTLLGLDTTALPITPDEKQVLKACRSQQITPGALGKAVPKDSRQRLIRALADRGLVKATQTQITTVTLTPQGKTFLQHDFQPKGANPILSGSLLGHYLNFLRQAWQPTASVPLSAPNPAPSPNSPAKPSADALLAKIIELDQQTGSDNYLPLFHLRNALQPPLSREDLDQQLYELQRQDRIELSTLQEVSAYSSQEREAGIPQAMNSLLFFVTVNDER